MKPIYAKYRQFCFKPATLPFTKMTLKDKYVHSKLDTFVSFWKLHGYQQKLKMQLLNKLYLKLGLYLDHASRFQDQDHTFHFWAFFSFWKLPLSPQTRNNGFNFSVGNFQHISLTFSFKTCKWFKAQHRQSWKLDGREMDFHSWILYIQNKKGQKEEKLK